jgi:hypothetical protein
MSQHDFDIANQTSSNARADINNALKALASTSSGTTAPSTTYANMLWYDTSANILKMRAEADDAWINIGYVDQSADAFRILDDTQVVTTAGSQTGLLGDQATGTWQAGTGTTESLVSPAKIKAAIIALYSAASGPDFTTQVAFTSSVTSAAHGLGAVPSRWEVKIVCTSTDLGYAVGDVICLTSHNEGGGLRGNTASVNATNIQIAGNSVFIQTKTAGGVTALTNTKWDVIFECWK